ncbi:MAG: GNAT family N-acetyltransferase [Ignavibacteriales bacterium]|nr:GNAT family N-acetyltransferase [Ignavibacteriales bacterium]
MLDRIIFRELTTGRLTLRKLRLSDDKELYAIRSNDGVNKYLERSPAASIDEAQLFIKKINDGIDNNGWIYWAIALKDDDKVIGTICIWNISSEDASGEIGYELKPEFQGRGFMSEAIKKVIDFGFNDMRLKSLEAFTHKENLPSIKLLERNNFKRNYLFEQKHKEELQKRNTIIYSRANSNS